MPVGRNDYWRPSMPNEDAIMENVLNVINSEPW